MAIHGTWRHQAVVGAVLLSCATVGVAQAVSTVHPRSEQTSELIWTWTSDPLDASLLDPANYVPTPSLIDSRADFIAALAGESTDPEDPVDPADTTVIDETRKERIAEVSADTQYDVPMAALIAYRRAAIVMAQTTPNCHLSWPILAAIGQVESDQGRYAGAHVLADGTTSPHIVGMALNGQGPIARISDTDDGQYDGDTVWDRAVGPMQFIPSTWAAVGVDGDGDGVRNPHDFDDAALAAGVYLCAGGRDLSTTPGVTAAVYSYNHSDQYVALVLSLAKHYESGGIDVVPNDTTPGIPHPDDTGSGSPAPRPRPTGVLLPKPHHNPGNGPGTGPGTEPKPTILRGTLSGCTDAATATPQWCVDTTVLNFGAEADLRPAQADYDADGVAEPVSIELAGLRGTQVRVRLDGVEVVDQINGLSYTVTPVRGDPPPNPTEPTPTEPTPTEPTPTEPTPTEPTPTEPTPTEPKPTATQPKPDPAPPATEPEPEPSTTEPESTASETTPPTTETISESGESIAADTTTTEPPTG